MQHSTSLLSYKTSCAFLTLYSVSARWLGCVGEIMSNEGGQGTFFYGFTSAPMVGFYLWSTRNSPSTVNIFCLWLPLLSYSSPRLMDALVLLNKRYVWIVHDCKRSFSVECSRNCDALMRLAPITALLRPCVGYEERGKAEKWRWNEEQSKTPALVSTTGHANLILDLSGEGEKKKKKPWSQDVIVLITVHNVVEQRDLDRTRCLKNML